MAVPSIDSITPTLGLGSGMTLVEVSGSGFRLPLPADSPGPSNPSPRPTVRVRIGGRSAEGVLVYADDYLTCLTPEGDPFDVSFAATANATTDLFACAGHTFKDGDRLRITGTLPAPLLLPDARDAVPYFARDVIDGVSFAVALTSGGDAIDLTTAGGAMTVTSEGYADVEVANLDDDGGVPITGEIATLARAFSFRLPDLTAEAGSLALVMRSLILMLRRSIHRNVVFTTHTDYDPSTNDQLNIAALASLPALVLTNVDLPEDRQRAAQGHDETVISGGRFLARRAPVIVDLTATLVGVSDDETEFFNMIENTRTLFQKRDKLRVPRSLSGAYDDGIDYALTFAFGSVSVTTGDGANPNLKSFGGTISVMGIRLEAAPGAPSAGTAAKPSDRHHEATIAIGYTAETINLAAEKKDPSAG